MAYAAEVEGVRVAPLAAVVTNKVWIINDFSFDPRTARGVQGGLNRDTLTDEVPQFLWRKKSSAQILGRNDQPESKISGQENTDVKR